jgi:uncharacterized membrane protein YphA (DoxX/SURF4 family)/thiol-disulfide isomerase/thioredoxin
VDEALLLARLALAVVFATAAVAKLLDLSGSRAALTGFGVPAPLAAVGGTLLPLAELAVAIAVVPAPTARWAAVGAVVLLLSFIGAIARSLARGQAPDCHCFGQVHSEPAGGRTLARNLALAALAAGVAAAGPGAGVSAWAPAVAVLLGLSLVLWSENRRLVRELRSAPRGASISGLPIGSPAPDFAVLPPGRPLALVFTDPGCGPCQTLLPELRRWQQSLAEALTIAVIERDEPDGREVADAYRIRGTPSAVVVSPAGTVASAPAEGSAAIEALIRVSLSGRTPVH